MLIVSTAHTMASPAEDGAGASHAPGGAREPMTPLAARVHGEYAEMPGLRLTVAQAARLFNVSQGVADGVLSELERASVLARSTGGIFGLIAEPARRRPARPAAGTSHWTNDMTTQRDAGTPAGESLREVSLDRLVCLRRHWTWANEAMLKFDQELASTWDFDDDPLSDHPFGAYYHWCALLCAFGDAALGRGLLPPLQLEPIRDDLEAILPGLRACRQLLVVIPDTLEEQPRIVELVRDDETLGRLRRVHEAIGDALRREQVSREIDALDQ